MCISKFEENYAAAFETQDSALFLLCNAAYLSLPIHPSLVLTA
jgi:hypothetical protein